jgi:hypothetical protein
MRFYVRRSSVAMATIIWMMHSGVAFAGRIPPKPNPPSPPPAPGPTPPAVTGEMEFAITPFANMEHGWHIFEPGYRAVCTDSQGVVATATLSIDAAINGETADGKGAFQALIIRPATQYQRSGLTSGTCNMTICLDQNADKPEAPANCKPVASVTNPDPERALSFNGQVPYKASRGKISLQTGAPGLSAWHPVFSFAAPGKAFKDFQSPLVLDLDGDGQWALTSPWDESHVTRFDLALDGKPYPTGWVSAPDGFLAIDDNGNGAIDHGGELFGEVTGGRVGGKKTFPHGFAALARFDANLDGVIDQRDRDFGRLRIWIDRNGNGRSDEGELLTMNAAQIKSFNLEFTSLRDRKGGYPVMNGNEIRLSGVFTKTDGRTHKMADVWFKQRRFSDNATAMNQWLLNVKNSGH